MMTIMKVRDANKAGHYFEKDNYYVKGEGLTNSEWMGKAAAELGLGASVDPEDFLKCLKGEFGEQVLGRTVSGKVQHTPGWDCTFNAPKSVSIASLVLGDKRLLMAHQEAVKAAISFLENKAALTRIKVGERVEFLNTKKLLVASFQHDTSRDLDPHLHTHCVVINATPTPNGMRSLHSKKLYQLKMNAGLIYQSELASKVKKLGYSVDIKQTQNTKNSVFEIGNIPNELITEFSKRRNKIKDYLDKKGIDSNAINSQIATLRTRPGKKEVDRSVLLNEWNRRLDTHGFSVETLKAKPGATGSNDDADIRRFVVRAIHNVSRMNMSFKLDDVSRDSMRFLLGKANNDDIKKVVDQAVREKLLLKTEYRDAYNVDNLYTTPKNLRLEAEIIGLARKGKNTAPFAYNEIFIDKKLKQTTLNSEQKNAVKVALSSGDRFVAIQGLSGVGKTTLLREVFNIAKKDDIDIVGLGPTHTAVNEMRVSTGIKAQTLAASFGDSSKNEGGKHLWVIDESSFISAQDKIKIMNKAIRQDAKVLFVGDEKQLGSIEAGRAFHLLMKANVDTAKVNKIVRQKDGSAHLLANYAAAGLTDEAINLLDRENNIIELKDSAERIDKCVEIWANKSLEERDGTLVLAPTNYERRQINDKVRAILGKEGVLSGDKVNTYSFSKKQFTPLEMRYTHTHSLGEYVRFERDYKNIDVKKGDYFKVTGIDNKNNKLIVSSVTTGHEVVFNPARIGGNKRYGMQVFDRFDTFLQKGDQVVWKDNKNDFGLKNNSPLTIKKVTDKYVYYRGDEGEYKMKLSNAGAHHFDFRYASTIYSAQGRTADHVITLADSAQEQLVNAASFYVAVTRPRYGATVITDSTEQLKRSLRDRSGINTLATDSDELDKLIGVVPGISIKKENKLVI